MFERIKTIFEIRAVLRRGEFVGDAAALKLSLMGADEPACPHTAAVRAMRARNFEQLSPAQLAQLPSGSFGEAYAAFLRDHGLSALNFSERSSAIFDKHPVATRYIRVHDMIHVLLGFGPDVAGELGVYAFIARQDYGATLNRAARTASRLASLMFWARARMRAAEARGQRLAQGAAILIAEPLEDWLGEPLDAVRSRLGLAAAADGEVGT